MKALRSIAAALPSAPARKLRATLVRRVPLSPLIESGAVDYLFMSGRPSRFNTAGVRCVYFAEDEATAEAEYERHTWPLRQPFATFFADVELAAVLDLCSAGTLKTLNLTPRDLQANWARAKRPTVAQLLGEAMSQQARLAAIRYPSDAARMKGFAGANVVIFRDSLRRPDHVHILGPTKKPLQKWP
jgi:RES domain-containing protein